ncbi:hypothetical protein GGI42DRAFT_301424 [Trichoderma sp. SZMC 28013]
MSLILFHEADLILFPCFLTFLPGSRTGSLCDNGRERHSGPANLSPSAGPHGRQISQGRKSRVISVVDGQNVCCTGSSIKFLCAWSRCSSTASVGARGGADGSLGVIVRRWYIALSAPRGQSRAAVGHFSQRAVPGVGAAFPLISALFTGPVAAS